MPTSKTNPKTFKKIINALSDTTKRGDLIESLVIDSLIKKFGEKNVTKISGYGNADDMRGGIDVQVKLNGLTANGQIKPAREIVNENNGIFVENTIDSMAEAMSKMVETTSDYSAELIREQCLSKYGSASIALGLKSIYSSLIK